MNLILAALLVATPAPEFEFRFDRGSVTLTKAACTDPKVANRIKDEYRKLFLAGRAVFDKRPMAFCWTADKDTPGHIFIIDEHGEIVSLPAAAFKPKGTEV